MTIACDFDSTLCQSESRDGYRMGPPEPGAVASVRRLVNEGNTVIIFTARNVQDPRVKKAVADWLDYFEIPFSGITNIKSPHFDVYIDDRCLRFDSWPQVLARLTAMQKSSTV